MVLATGRKDLIPKMRLQRRLVGVGEDIQTDEDKQRPINRRRPNMLDPRIAPANTMPLDP